jgi:hypothetical protein
LAGSAIKKSTQEIIDIDGGEEIGNNATDKLTNKGAVKSQETDKENGANSGFEDDEVGGASPYIDEAAKQRDLSSIRRRKINDFITDKAYRVRSFLRRRGVPLTRTTEMDIQGCAKMLILKFKFKSSRYSSVRFLCKIFFYIDSCRELFCGFLNMCRTYLSSTWL